MKKHYSVVQNMPGYLPDSPADWFHTLRSARDHAQWLADQFRDDGEYRVEGNKRDGYFVSPKDGHGADYVIQVYGPFYAPCDPDCDD